jgi:OTU domain-containing protein 6
LSINEHTDGVGLEQAITTLSLENVESVLPNATKKNKAKIRKERKLRELEDERRKAGEEARHITNHKEIEQVAIEFQLKKMGLCIKEIPADGHCLYSSIADQLLLVGHHFSYRDLRKIAVEYIRQNVSDFLPFMTDADGDLLDQAGLEKYLDDCEHGSIWGGQFEIQALSRSLKREIQIIQANSPILKIGEEFDSSPLRISYHRHSFGLGEHYNSLHMIE